MSAVIGVDAEKDSVKCQGCGKQIFWGAYWKDGDGVNAGREVRVPLDPSAPVYRVIGRHPKGHIFIERDREVAVTHFKTCTKAQLFSKAVAKEADADRAYVDGDPGLYDEVEVVDGPFAGLKGTISRECKKGPNVHESHRHYLDWWLTVKSDEGESIGCCFVGSAQVKILAKAKSFIEPKGGADAP